MRKFTLVLSICFAALLASSASAQQIYGEYIESRNADVYTGTLLRERRSQPDG